MTDLFASIGIVFGMSLLVSLVEFFNKSIFPSDGTKKNKPIFIDIIFGTMVASIIIGLDEIFFQTSNEKPFLYELNIIIVIAILTKSLFYILTISLEYSIYFWVSYPSTTSYLPLYVAYPLFFLLFSIVMWKILLPKRKNNYLSFMLFMFATTMILSFTETIYSISGVTGINNIWGSSLTYNGTKYQTYVVLLFVFLIGNLNLYLSFIINNFFVKTSIISNYSKYEIGNFYKQGLIYNVVHNYIKKYDTNNAMFFTFKLLPKKEKNDFLEKNILDDITNAFQTKWNTIFVKVKWNVYGVFFAWDKTIENLLISRLGNLLEKREESDYLFEIEELMTKVFKNYKTYSYISTADFYGKTFNDISLSIKSTNFMYNYFEENSYLENKILVYDHKLYLDTYDVNYSINEIKNQVDFEKLVIEFKKVKLKNSNLYVLRPIYKYKLSFLSENEFENLIKKFRVQRNETIFWRKLAYLTLKEYVVFKKNNKTKEKLILDYTLLPFYNVYGHTQKFLNELEKIGIKPKNVILAFNSEQLKIPLDKMKNIIKELSNFGFEFLLSNYSILEKEKDLTFKIIRPKFVEIRDKMTHNLYLLKIM